MRRMRAAVVDAPGRAYYLLCQHACSGRGYAWAGVSLFVPACVQRSWMRLGVRIIICASMHAAVVDTPGRVYHYLCQHACSGRGCAWACVLPLVPAHMLRSWMRVGVCTIICASTRAAVMDARGVTCSV